MSDKCLKISQKISAYIDGALNGEELAAVKSHLDACASCSEEFRAFAKRYATSPEIGPIKTSLDGGADKAIDFDRVLVGLRGCGTLCAVACFHRHQSVLEKNWQALKLDSVIVDDRLRRRGLAGLLVTQSFIDLILDRTRRVASIYAYSVHPGTLYQIRVISSGCGFWATSGSWCGL